MNLQRYEPVSTISWCVLMKAFLFNGQDSHGTCGQCLAADVLPILSKKTFLSLSAHLSLYKDHWMLPECMEYFAFLFGSQLQYTMVLNIRNVFYYLQKKSFFFSKTKKKSKESSAQKALTLYQQTYSGSDLLGKIIQQTK